MVLATLCYIQKENQTLMIHFKKPGMSYDKWNGVGGKLDAGESPDEAVVREVYEETNLKIKNPKLRGFLSFPNQYKGVDWNVFIYVATEFEGVLKKKNHEGTLHWVKNSKIKELNLWGDDVYWLHLLNQNKFFTGKFNFSKDNTEVLEAHVKLH